MDEITRYKTSQVAEIFLVKPYTVIRWADKFFDQLDVGAKPEDGKARYFTDLDVRKLALVHKMYKEDKSEDEIRIRLINGEVENPPDAITALAYMDSKNVPVHLQKHVAQLELSLAEAKKELEDEKFAHRETAGKLNESRRRVETLEHQLLEANKKVWSLESKK